MKTLHIVTGLLALLAGAAALYASKGSRWHRNSGQVFGATMVLMTASALVMALFVHLNRLNVIAASLTLYLVLSGWSSVIRPLAQSRLWLSAQMTMSLSIALCAGWWSQLAFASSDGRIDGMLPQPIVAFGFIALIGASMDLRLLLGGSLAGGHRLARHLWRMSTAMLIATTSLFLGQPRFLPEFLRESMPLRALPVLLVLGVMGYWLVRVLVMKGLKRRSRRTGDGVAAVSPAVIGR